MKTGICVLGLHKEFINKIANNLAKKLDMFFVDVDELVNYEIINPDYIIEQCGNDYLIKLQRDCVKRASFFENSVRSIEYKLINDDQNINQIKSTSLLIYVRLSKSSYNLKNKYMKIKKLKYILDDYMFNQRDEVCLKESDIVIESDGKSYLQISNIIIDKLKNMI